MNANVAQGYFTVLNCTLSATQYALLGPGTGPITSRLLIPLLLATRTVITVTSLKLILITMGLARMPHGYAIALQSQRGFTNTAAHNYTESSCSSALVDSGTNDGVGTDILGLPAQGANWDIGAYEIIGCNTNTPTNTARTRRRIQRLKQPLRPRPIRTRIRHSNGDKYGN